MHAGGGSGRLAPFDLFRLGLARGTRGADLDLAGFHLLWDLALEVDRQQAIGQTGAGDLHVIGQLKAPLEGPSGNATVQKLGIILGFLLA